MSGYKLTKADVPVCIMGVVGNIALFSWVLGDTDNCTVDNPVSGFTGTRVTILRTTCDDESENSHAARFALLLIAAFALRFSRSLLSWEVAQESRVLLKQEKTERLKSNWRYQSLYFVNNLAYLIELILIMGRNLWVYIALLLARQAATYEFFKRSDSDQKRMKAAPPAINASTGDTDNMGGTGGTLYKF